MLMNKICLPLLFVLLFFSPTMTFACTTTSFPPAWPGTTNEARTEVLRYVNDPYVFLPPDGMKSSVLLPSSDINRVRLLDLRGLECYPQPDRLTACGEGDTLSLLLYTKSEEPILDVFVELNFGEGIIFDGSASIGSPDGMMMTLLDIVNTENPESPVFRLDQLSRSGGAVVLQVGIRALCGVDFAASPPSIDLALEYPGCEEEFELAPITTEPITPEVVFTNTPNQIIIRDFDTDVCLRQEITQVTFGAGAGEATLTIAGYGFPAVSLNEIMVDGVTVPSSDVSINPINGTATVRLDGNANPGYFNADGLLSTNEVSALDLCFSITACPPSGTPDPITPTLAINSTCMGISCGGNQDFETGNTIRIIPNFGNNPIAGFELIQQPSACAGPGGNAEQYVFDATIRASRTEPVQGQLNNLRFFLDDCDGGAFVIDSVGFFEGGVTTGTLRAIPNISPIVSLSATGRILVSMRSLVQDFDGPGGLADLDGDGFVDDLPGGEMFRARLFLSPVSCAAPGACGASPPEEGNTCLLRRLSFQGSRNCGRNNFTTNLNPGGDPFQNNTTGGYGNADTTRLYTGYNFGTFGRTGSAGNPVSQTRTVEFDFTLVEGDFNACPAPGGDLQFQLTYIGDSATVDNLVLDNLMYDNDTTDMIPPVVVPASALTRLNTGSTVTFTVDAGSGTTNVPMRYSVDMTFDTAVCAPVANNPLIVSVVERCDACECSPFVRACATAVARVDPNDAPNCNCDYVGTATANRINYGFQDRGRTVPLTAADFPGPDNQQLDFLLPGDTLDVTAEIKVTNARNWNGLTERINFFLLGLQAGSSVTPNLLARMDINAVRIQSFVIERGATTFDVADMPVNGSTVGGFAGILINGTSGAATARYPNTQQPGLPVDGYTQVNQNSTNDYQDNNRIQVFFAGEDRVLPGEFNSLQGLYDLVGGNFEDGDIIRWNFRVPVVLTPDELRDGSATTGPLSRNDIILRASVDGRSFVSPGVVSTNQIGGGGVFNGNNGTTACLFQDTVFVHDAQMTMESRITYAPDGCGAEIEHEFSILNPLPAGWYPNEYRPIIGLDSLNSEFPDPYIFAGGAYYELSGADGTESMGRVLIEPDSLAKVTGDEIAYCTDADGIGELYFFDAEKQNGVRNPDYFDFDTDNDVSISGGTFPLIGVGGNAITNPDEFTVGYPLQRICTDQQPSTPLISGFSGAYPYLADYKVNGYLCNQGDWYPGGPLDVAGTRNCNGQSAEERFYWPWLRESLENPHRISGSDEYDEVNTPVPNNAVTATLTEVMLQDLGGGEMNTLTVCPDPTTGTIPGGTIVLEVPLNVTLDGATETATSAPAALTLVMNTDTSVVYTIAIPTGLNAGDCYEVDLETSLLFCGPDPICARIVPCPVDVNIVLVKDLDCVETICYSYRSGLPEAAVGFTFPTPTLCTTDTYQVNFNNTGTSLLTDVDPVIWLPDGLIPTNFMVEISAQGVVTSSGPINAMEDPDSTGVNGVAYVFDDVALNALLGTDGLEPLGAISIFFDLTSDCESTSGGRAVAQLGAMGDCDPYLVTERGPQIFLVDPSGDADFSIEPDRTEINCTEGGANLLITSINVGKAGATETSVCLTLPPGLTINSDNIQAIAPIDYVPTNFEATSIGTEGTTQLCFDGPEDLPIGAFFCLEIGFELDPAVDCGPLTIGYTVMSTVSAPCTDGMICELETLNSEQFLDLEVVPATAIVSAEVLAECNDDPSMIDLDFTITLENLGTSFSDNVDVQLFFDLDANGQVDPFDTPLGTVSSTVTVPVDGVGVIEGSVTASTDQSCGLVARLTIPGCTCSEIEIAFPEVEPGFADRLNDNITICPNETFTIDGLCGMYELAFSPPVAGNIEVDMAAGTAEIGLNPGFGVEVPIDLVVTYSIGNCSGQEFIIKVSQLEEFDFGPYEVTVCSAGSQRLDLNIPAGIQEDLEVLITPDTYLDDPTSLEPVITDPEGDISYLVEFTLNGDCMSQTTLDIVVEPAPVLTFAGATGCSTGFRMAEYTTISPPDTDVFFSTTGDGTFTPTNRLADMPVYVPGPGDLAAGSAAITARTENPDGPCGLIIARTTIEILLVDCGAFFWDGERN
jgi:hypothetical protein